ncbi:MAG: DUF4926 domain-containing protein [Symploca sp. SIO2E6]|nr:DUF4926 domain-containing protein [Symploca sp. SIO2E6]
MLELYQRVTLIHDLPEYNLKKGDVVTLMDYVAHPSGGENGYVVEVFNAVGESIDVIAVPMSAVQSLRNDEILSVRSLAKAS